jgi:hypothetical protein
MTDDSGNIYLLAEHVDDRKKEVCRSLLAVNTWSKCLVDVGQMKARRFRRYFSTYHGQEKERTKRRNRRSLRQC